MTRPVSTLVDPILRDIEMPMHRALEARPSGLPADLEVISSDDHWELDQDIFYERFPADLKEKAPRVWFDEYWRIGYPTNQAVQAGKVAKRFLQEGFTDGLFDLDLRVAHMQANGVSKEIIFPQSILLFFGYPDLELRQLMFRAYNEHVAERAARHPGKFFPVGICSNWWDPAQMPGAVAQIKELGLKTLMLPTKPGKLADGQDITYGGEYMDAFWAAVQDFDLPVCFHVAESQGMEGQGMFGGFLLQTFAPFRNPFGQIVFGGVLDRFPTLKIVFAEGGLSWVPPMLQDAEMVFDSYHRIMEPALHHRPTHYWFQNFYATFQNDRLGLQQLDLIGEDRVMWAADYPHPEGSHGFAGRSMQSVWDLVGERTARKILGGTAKAVFDL